METNNASFSQKIQSVKPLENRTAFIVRTTRGPKIYLDKKNLLGLLKPIAGYYLVSCRHSCYCATGTIIPHKCIRNDKCDVPCDGQCFYVLPERARKIQHGDKSKIIRDVRYTTWPTPKWHIVHDHNNKTTLKPEYILGRAKAPEVGKYLVPCNLVCAHRGDKCIRNPKFDCNQQLFYIRDIPVWSLRKKKSK